MTLKQSIKRVLPASVFQMVRDVPWAIQDLRSRPPVNHGPIPPLRLMFDGPRGYDIFLETGRETLEFYKTVAGMKPCDAILDIGCGIGRKTLPLLSYLDQKALYVGMEIDRRGVEWLQRNVAAQNQRFSFLQLDIYSRFYNPAGTLHPGTLAFPFAGGSFDMIVLWSVFTHMYPDDIAHYLSEIGRLLKPGGKLAASFYLYDEVILDCMQRGQTKINFHHPLENCRTTNPNIPEDAMAVGEQWLGEAMAKASLQPLTTMHGSWSGRAPHPALPIINFQDIVLAQKV